jgi:predicted DNA helicase
MLKNFIDRLKKLVEIERKAQIEAMLNEIKNLSGEERERRGRAILNLNGKVVGEEFGYKLVKFGRRRKIETNINVGDLVLISRGNPLKSDLVGVVAEKGNRYIVVALENVPSWALKDVRIDLYANDVTFRRWLENLENLGDIALKALKFALGLEMPDKPEKVYFKPIDERLNESQREAVALALGSNDFFLIHGPFGTGKTRTLAEIVRQEVKRGRKVLATAESNVAVDNLVELLKDYIRKLHVLLEERYAGGFKHIQHSLN